MRYSNHDIIGIRSNNTEVMAVYKARQLVWQKISDQPLPELLSCFALGYWADEYPWTDDLSW